MPVHSKLEFGLSQSRQQMLVHTLQALKAQQESIENIIKEASDEQVKFKAKIEKAEKEYTDSLKRKEELLQLAKSPKDFRSKHKKELERCNDIIEHQDVLIRARLNYQSHQERIKEMQLQVELIKFNRQEIYNELNNRFRTLTPYQVIAGVKNQIQVVLSEDKKEDTHQLGRSAPAA